MVGYSMENTCVWDKVFVWHKKMVILNSFVAGTNTLETPGRKPSYQFPQHGALTGIVSWFIIYIDVFKEIYFSHSKTYFECLAG